MTAQRIHLLPEVQTAPTVEERRVRDLERDLAALRDALLLVVMAVVALMVLVALVILGVIG